MGSAVWTVAGRTEAFVGTFWMSGVLDFELRAEKSKALVWTHMRCFGDIFPCKFTLTKEKGAKVI